jgi:hypothetical protein
MKEEGRRRKEEVPTLKSRADSFDKVCILSIPLAINIREKVMNC